MPIKLLAGAAAISLVIAVPAFALESNVSMTSSMSPDALWQKVGDFCGVGTWHPAIENCELNDGGKMRTISLKGGGTIVERMQSRDDAKHSYTYSIVSGPLPVTNYLSTIAVLPDPKGSKVTWMGQYDAKGASDADAKKAIDGVYESGEKGLVGG